MNRFDVKKFRRENKDEVVRLESFTNIAGCEVRICFKHRRPKNFKPKTIARAQWLLGAARKRMRPVA